METATIAEPIPLEFDSYDDFKKSSDEAFALAEKFGLRVELGDWLTVKRYAEKYGHSIATVTNWISRGRIPADCVEELPELNNIRLVRDRPYPPRVN